MKTHPASAFRPKPMVLTIDTKDSFDVLGDLHGCADEAHALLEALGHQVSFPKDPNEPALVTFAPGKRIAFLGDITDRGPRSVDTLRLVEGTLQASGVCVFGNHDSKLLRTLAGHKVEIANGLQTTLDQLEAVAPETRTRWRDMLLNLPHQAKIPAPDTLSADGWLTLVHGAAPAHHQDQDSKNSFSRALYGYADGATDSHGNLIREDWAEPYRGERAVAHGHTPLEQVSWKNRVTCLDTGAVFGGKLSAMNSQTLDILQITSGVCAKVRPGVSQDTPVFGKFTQLHLHSVAQQTRTSFTSTDTREDRGDDR